jgi:PPOX class probable F420-dependent enzyme
MAQNTLLHSIQQCIELQDGQMAPEEDLNGVLDELASCRLLDLTTMRGSGVPVTTPVRFAIDDGRVIVSLDAASHKMTRVRMNPRVRVAGHQSTSAIGGTLRMLEHGEGGAAYRVLARRHRLLFLQRLALRRHPSRHVTCKIVLDGQV